MDTITLSPLRAPRRRYSREFKIQIVETYKQPGTSVAAIARMHDINDAQQEVPLYLAPCDGYIEVA